MDWRERSDLWFGTALLRPMPDSPSAEFGGAYVSFALVAPELRSAAARLLDWLSEEHWEVSSLEGMKRASDYKQDDAEATDSGVAYAEMVESADRWGVWLGAIHTFPKGAQKPQ